MAIVDQINPKTYNFIGRNRIDMYDLTQGFWVGGKKFISSLYGSKVMIQKAKCLIIAPASVRWVRSDARMGPSSQFFSKTFGV